MKGMIFIFLSLIIFNSNAFTNDTLYIKPNVLLVDNSTNYLNIDDVELLYDNKYFCGYLIIALDSNSYRENKLNASIFWIENLDSIENENAKYYYSYFIGLLSDSDRRFENGKNDKLSVFMHYYNLFNYNNTPNYVSYLYPFSGQFLSTNLLYSVNIWEKGKNGIIFIIYETSFYTSILLFKNLNRKIFIPTSNLFSFFPIKFENAVELGFSLSKYIIREF